jgi:multidrug efflux pump
MGGMLFSLILTLYIIPLMYVIFASKTRRDPDEEPEEETVPEKKRNKTD